MSSDNKSSGKSVFIPFCDPNETERPNEENLEIESTDVINPSDDNFSDENTFGLDIESLADKRKERRFPLMNPIMIQGNGEPIVAKGSGVNLSLHGIGLKLKAQSLQIGDEYFIEFLGSAKLRSFSVTCKLENLEEIEGEEGFVIAGLSFIKASKINEAIIAEYIKASEEISEKWKVSR